MALVYIKTINCRGTEYKAFREKGKVIVRAKSTAQGQYLVRGVYDISAKTWHNEHLLPRSVKNEVEKSFEKPE